MLVMLVKERMNPSPIIIRPDGTLAEARALLDQHRIRHLPVIEEGGLVGIIRRDHEYLGRRGRPWPSDRGKRLPAARDAPLQSEAPGQASRARHAVHQRRAGDGYGRRALAAT